MDEIKLGLADAAPELAFGKEWIELERGRSEVLHDFIESNLTAQEYLDNIWAGLTVLSLYFLMTISSSLPFRDLIPVTAFLKSVLLTFPFFPVSSTTYSVSSRKSSIS